MGLKCDIVWLRFNYNSIQGAYSKSNIVRIDFDVRWDRRATSFGLMLTYDGIGVQDIVLLRLRCDGIEVQHRLVNVLRMIGSTLHNRVVVQVRQWFSRVQNSPSPPVPPRDIQREG